MSKPFEGYEHVVRSDELLAPYTTLGIGGPAEYFAEPTSAEELTAILQRAEELELPVRLLGQGSNLLIRDEGVAGLVLHLSSPEFAAISVAGDSIEAGGGCRLSHFISVAAREGFVGPELLAGIPGTIGGALHHNTDSNGDDIGQWVTSARVMTRDGNTHERSGSELNFSYRSSSLTELAVLGAKFEFRRGDQTEISARMQKEWIVRKASQPTAGEKTAYVFKMTGGTSADSLIEQAGLKGSRIGEAELYQRNSSFILAHHGACSSDVLRLIDICKSQVSSRVGAELETGIEVW